ILMDIQLPGLDGYEATRRIKGNPALRHIPIIVVTSYALSGDDVKAFEAGCDAYVTKPFVPRELLAKVREYLSKAEGGACERPPVFSSWTTRRLTCTSSRRGWPPMAMTS